MYAIRSYYGADHRNPTGADRLTKGGQEGALQIEKTENRVERAIRKIDSGFQILKTGLYREPPANGLFPQLIQSFRRQVDGGNGEAPLRKIKGIASSSAGDIEDFSPRKQGLDALSYNFV